MDRFDKDIHSSNEQTVAVTIKKIWINPEIRDQSINSLTEGKPNSNPTEASPGTGS